MTISVARSSAEAGKPAATTLSAVRRQHKKKVATRAPWTDRPRPESHLVRNPIDKHPTSAAM